MDRACAPGSLRATPPHCPQPWGPPLLSLRYLLGPCGQWGLWILSLGPENNFADGKIWLCDAYVQWDGPFPGLQRPRWEVSTPDREESLGGGQPQRPQRERTALPHSLQSSREERLVSPTVRQLCWLEPERRWMVEPGEGCELVLFFLDSKVGPFPEYTPRSFCPPPPDSKLPASP